ncbi:MAG: hypothetical protein A2Z25_08550 [Planctomycetes bacterium RBG_16_55_9]|nr:MAG: hypothetical protein A2Z25_08550 [Planctomycetes bacterium RBG_16_55_9]
MHKCPKQEQRGWTPNDVIEVRCPGCGRSLEFFKDEESRKCRGCGQKIANPEFEMARSQRAGE